MRTPQVEPHPPCHLVTALQHAWLHAGWFAVFGGMMGCSVLAFEPVPHFHAFLEFSTHLNGLAGRVDMRGNVVRGCWVCYGGGWGGGGPVGAGECLVRICS